jgi:hypothetical protein
MVGFSISKKVPMPPDANHSTGVYGDVTNFNGEKLKTNHWDMWIEPTEHVISCNTVI